MFNIMSPGFSFFLVAAIPGLESIEGTTLIIIIMFISYIAQSSMR